MANGQCGQPQAPQKCLLAPSGAFWAPQGEQEPAPRPAPPKAKKMACSPRHARAMPAPRPRHARASVLFPQAPNKIDCRRRRRRRSAFE
eukprot:gene20995-biopygen10146